jgi:hypothetical protein
MLRAHSGAPGFWLARTAVPPMAHSTHVLLGAYCAGSELTTLKQVPVPEADLAP